MLMWKALWRLVVVSVLCIICANTGADRPFEANTDADKPPVAGSLPAPARPPLALELESITDKRSSFWMISSS